MEIERDKKIRKVNGVKFMNVKSLTGIRDGIENGDIPEWLLVEVLIRLPAKLVFRFKLVSKQWFFIISDPSFVRAYISRASLLSQPWTFLSIHMHDEGFKRSYFPKYVEYVSLDDVYFQFVKQTYCVVPLPFTQQSNPGGRYRISGVSNGLVLYNLRGNSGEVKSYYICNPITGQWITLPPFTCHLSMQIFGFLTQVEDYVIKSYRVVQLDWFTRKVLKFEVFFSEIGEWKNFIVSTDIENSLSIQKEATTFNGILHWIAYEHGIIAYDPYRSPEQIRIIAFPANMINRKTQNYSNSFCVACQGKLRYFRVSTMNISGCFELWVLNDYSSGDWSLQHNISYKDVQYDTNLSFNISSIRPISFHPFDSDIVYLGYKKFLVTYNIKTRKLAVQHKFFKQNLEWRFCFLFVIPPWPMSIPCSSSGARDV